jgi:hypothetical protein
MDPHPDPHQTGKSLNPARHQSDQLDPDRINFQMTSQILGIMSLFEHFFKCLNLYLEAKIWIRFRIRVKGRSGFASN